jgi:hypothetical protein
LITPLFFTNVHAQVELSTNVFKTQSQIVKDNNPDSVFYYTWNKNNGLWNEKERYVYDYSGDLLIHEIYSAWEEGAWQIKNKTSNSYNSSAITRTTTYWWDWYFTEWLNLTRLQYDYNEDQTLSSRTYNKWSFSNSQWLNDSLFTYDYSNGLLTELIDNVWYDSLNEWGKLNRKTYFYDSLSLNTLQIHYTWDFDLNNWSSNNRYQIKYDTKKNIDEIILTTKLGTNNNWENYRKTRYSYNSNGTISKMVLYQWVYVDGDYKWLEDYKYNWIYDDWNNLYQIIEERFDWESLLWNNYALMENVFNSENYLMQKYFYKWTYGAWENTEKYSYNYPGYISSVNNFMELAFKIYPNPVQNKITIDFDDYIKGTTYIQLIDSRGSSCFQNIYNAQKKITVQLPILPNGYYLLKIVNNKNVFTKKLLIQH